MSHSGVLGVSTSTYEFWGEHSLTHNRECCAIISKSNLDVVPIDPEISGCKRQVISLPTLPQRILTHSQMENGQDQRNKQDHLEREERKSHGILDLKLFQNLIGKQF